MTKFSSKRIRLLFGAALLHIVVTTSIFVLGRNQLLPSTFDENGTAISVVPDGVGLLEDATALSKFLRQGDFYSWRTFPASFHTKAYAVSFLIFGPLFGFNILAAEPLNLLLYLGMIILTYRLAARVETSGALIAGTIVAVWPSLLLHSTQLVKDSLFIFEMLALILVLIDLLTRAFPIAKWPSDAVMGSLLAVLIWKTRSDQAPLLVGSILLAFGICLFRQIRERRSQAPNIVGIGLILAVTIAAILFLPVFQLVEHPRHQNRPPQSMVGKQGLHWWQYAANIGKVREGFLRSYPGFSSNVDTDVQINSSWDLVRYLPRATAIGLFAPFPNMWFEEATSVGATGRRLSGFEMILTYAIEFFAFLALWRARRRYSVWLIFSIAMMGVIALGIVITNVGALYRLRFIFLILLITLASGPIAQVFDRIGGAQIHTPTLPA